MPQNVHTFDALTNLHHGGKISKYLLLHHTVCHLKVTGIQTDLRFSGRK